MNTLMQMREWLFADERIFNQDEPYYKCVNLDTVVVFRSLVDNVDIKEYWRCCDEIDGRK